MIGKKDICPYCSEKVNIQGLVRNFWEKQTMTYANLLDAVRYLIVWNPIIVLVVQAILYMINEHPFGG